MPGCRRWLAVVALVLTLAGCGSPLESTGGKARDGGTSSAPTSRGGSPTGKAEPGPGTGKTDPGTAKTHVPG